MKYDKRSGADQEFNLQEYLKKCFQEIPSTNSAPEVLKKEVFDTLDTIQLIADVTDLFTVKYTQAESQLLDLVDFDPPADSAAAESDEDLPEEPDLGA